jgi:hypothetical protein
MQPARKILLKLAGHRTPDTPKLAWSGYAVGLAQHNGKRRLVSVLLTSVADLHRSRREATANGRSSTNL